MKKRERAAIESVAKHFSAVAEKGEGPRDAYIVIGRKRIAVEVTSLKLRTPNHAKFRLRFDKVVFEVIGRLRAALGDMVPNGRTVIVTITAPIRLASKTTAALEDAIRSSLARKSTSADIKADMYGNQIQVRIVKSGTMQIPKVVGLVHNPHPNPDALLDTTQALIQSVGAVAATSAASTKERWLIVAAENSSSHIKTYREIYAQLAVPTDFKKILMVSAEGQVEALAE